MKKFLMDISKSMSFTLCFLIPLIICAVLYFIYPTFSYMGLYLRYKNVVFSNFVCVIPAAFIFLLVKLSFKKIFDDIAKKSYFVMANNLSGVVSNEKDSFFFEKLLGKFSFMSIPLYLIFSLFFVVYENLKIFFPQFVPIVPIIYSVIYIFFVLYLLFYVSYVSLLYSKFLYDRNFHIENLKAYILDPEFKNYLLTYLNAGIILFAPAVIVFYLNIKMPIYALLCFILAAILFIPVSNVISIHLFISKENALKKSFVSLFVGIIAILFLLCTTNVGQQVFNDKIKQYKKSIFISPRELEKPYSIYSYSSVKTFKDKFYFMDYGYEWVAIYVIDSSNRFYKLKSTNVIRNEYGYPKESYSLPPIVLNDGKLLFEKTLTDLNGRSYENIFFDIWDLENSNKKSLELNVKYKPRDFKIIPLDNGDFLVASTDFVAKYDSQLDSFKIIQEFKCDKYIFSIYRPIYIKLNEKKYLIITTIPDNKTQEKKYNFNFYIYDDENENIASVSPNEKLANLLYDDNFHCFQRAYSVGKLLFVLDNKGDLHKFKLVDNKIKFLKTKKTALSKKFSKYVYVYLANGKYLVLHNKKIKVFDVLTNTIKELPFDNRKIKQQYIPIFEDFSTQDLYDIMHKIAVINEDYVYFFEFNKILKMNKLFEENN